MKDTMNEIGRVPSRLGFGIKTRFLVVNTDLSRQNERMRFYL